MTEVLDVGGFELDGTDFAAGGLALVAGLGVTLVEDGRLVKDGLLDFVAVASFNSAIYKMVTADLIEGRIGRMTFATRACKESVKYLLC